MTNKTVGVEILVNGKPIKQYWHQNNAWVEARNGCFYEIKLRNYSSRRVLAIVSVDGLDVLSGSPANQNSGGYIVGAYSSYSVKGFRVSDDEVNKFEFSSKGESYAVKSPDGEKSKANCGVIAVRFIEEKAKPIVFRKSFIAPRPRRIPMIPDIGEPYVDEPFTWKVTNDSFGYELGMKGSSSPRATMKLSASNNVLRMASLADETPDLDMGTKFSEETVEDKVTTTTFERGSLIAEVSIYYASRAALQDAGIEFEPKPKAVLPQGFKDSPYCKRPR